MRRRRGAARYPPASIGARRARCWASGSSRWRCSRGGARHRLTQAKCRVERDSEAEAPVFGDPHGDLLFARTFVARELVLAKLEAVVFNVRVAGRRRIGLEPGLEGLGAKADLGGRDEIERDEGRDNL